MNLNLNDLLSYWWVIGLACCVIPFILITLAAVWVARNAPRIVQPDQADLRRSFEALKAKRKNATTQELVNAIIARQSLRSGVIGAITSVGGLPTLPIALPIDLYTTARIQSAMLQFIAWAYQPTMPNSPQNALDLAEAAALRAGIAPNDLLLAGGQRLTRYAIRQIIVNVVEKSFAKLIPGIGLFIGFFVNYTVTRGLGYVAARYYTVRRAAPLAPKT